MSIWPKKNSTESKPRESKEITEKEEPIQIEKKDKALGGLAVLKMESGSCSVKLDTNMRELI